MSDKIREAFECRWQGHLNLDRTTADDRYLNEAVELAFVCFKEGAALAQQPAPVALPDGVSVEKDVFGTVHIKLGDFDFIQIQYDHRFTYNSHQEWVATRIVAAITATPTAEQQYSTTSDRYRAELYDEVWSQARLIGYANVTDALAELQRMKLAEQPDTVNVPMQPVELVGGVVRFKKNKIVVDLLSHAQAGGFGLNEIACEDYSDEDRMQLAQLIGYSVGGYGNLSYTSDESFHRAYYAERALLGKENEA